MARAIRPEATSHMPGRTLASDAEVQTVAKVLCAHLDAFQCEHIGRDTNGQPMPPDDMRSFPDEKRYRNYLRDINDRWRYARARALAGARAELAAARTASEAAKQAREQWPSREQSGPIR